MRDINLIVVHCSSTPADMDVGAAEIRQWHIERGWRDIGYHWVIRRNGAIEPGRPESEVGAHVKGYNANSIGVCMVGGSDKHEHTENNFTQEQFDTLKDMLIGLRGRYPNTRICGHRDLSPDLNHDGVIEPDEWIKDCPSFEVSEFLPTIPLEAQT